MIFRNAARNCLAALALAAWCASVAQADTTRFVDLRSAGRHLESGQSFRLTLGERVTLRWVADEPRTGLVHGYDASIALDPGVAKTMPFVARTAGRFPVGAHLPAAADGGKGGRHEPVLFYLEVHPE